MKKQYMLRSQTVAENKLTKVGQQFPWFQEWVIQQQILWKTVDIKEVRVQRTDLALCERVPRQRERIAFFDKTGKHIGTVGHVNEEVYTGFVAFLRNVLSAFINDWDWNETVEKAILRLEALGRQAYYVASYSSYRPAHLNDVAATAILYKPKGDSLPKWLEALRDGYKDELNETLRTIGDKLDKELMEFNQAP